MHQMTAMLLLSECESIDSYGTHFSQVDEDKPVCVRDKWTLKMAEEGTVRQISKYEVDLGFPGKENRFYIELTQFYVINNSKLCQHFCLSSSEYITRFNIMQYNGCRRITSLTIARHQQVFNLPLFLMYDPTIKDVDDPTNNLNFHNSGKSST